MANDYHRKVSRPITALFVDISGSSLLWAVRGDAEASVAIATCVDLLEATSKQSGGQVVKRVGDAILAVFDDARAAVNGAAAMQHMVDAPDSPLRGEGLALRTGIATGTAVLDGSDAYGDVINVAARLVSLGGSGEIFLDGETFNALSPDMRESVRLIDQIALRGRPDWVLVYEFLWKKEMATVSMPAARREQGGAARLVLTHGGLEFQVGLDRPKLRIGRNGDNDIVVADRVVSRWHAEVVMRGSKFFLVDNSANGTQVRPDGDAPVQLMREELVLVGAGTIIVVDASTAAPIAYRVR